MKRKCKLTFNHMLPFWVRTSLNSMDCGYFAQVESSLYCICVLKAAVYHCVGIWVYAVMSFFLVLTNA